MLSELVYHDRYRNTTQFIANYREPSGGKDLSQFNLSFRDFENRYGEPGSVKSSWF